MSKPHPAILPLLSFLLSLTVLILASHTYRVYTLQHAANPWWLPIWLSHFDTSGLVTSISCSAILVCVSALQVLCARFPRTATLGWMRLALVGSGLAAAVVMLVVPAVANSRDAARSDTVQTWTCRWEGVGGAPGDFGPLCEMSKFTSYAPIPILLCQLLLVGKCIQDLLALRQKQKAFEFEGEGEEELVGITKTGELLGQKGVRLDVESRASG